MDIYTFYSFNESTIAAVNFTDADQLLTCIQDPYTAYLVLAIINVIMFVIPFPPGELVQKVYLSLNMAFLLNILFSIVVVPDYFISNTAFIIAATLMIFSIIYLLGEIARIIAVAGCISSVISIVSMVSGSWLQNSVGVTLSSTSMNFLLFGIGAGTLGLYLLITCLPGYKEVANSVIYGFLTTLSCQYFNYLLLLTSGIEQEKMVRFNDAITLYPNASIIEIDNSDLAAISLTKICCGTDSIPCSVWFSGYSFLLWFYLSLVRFCILLTNETPKTTKKATIKQPKVGADTNPEDEPLLIQ